MSEKFRYAIAVIAQDGTHKWINRLGLLEDALETEAVFEDLETAYQAATTTYKPVEQETEQRPGPIHFPLYITLPRRVTGFIYISSATTGAVVQEHPAGMMWVWSLDELAVQQCLKELRADIRRAMSLDEAMALIPWPMYLQDPECDTGYWRIDGPHYGATYRSTNGPYWRSSINSLTLIHHAFNGELKVIAPPKDEAPLDPANCMDAGAPTAPGYPKFVTTPGMPYVIRLDGPTGISKIIQDYADGSQTIDPYLPSELIIAQVNSGSRQWWATRSA